MKNIVIRSILYLLLPATGSAQHMLRKRHLRSLGVLLKEANNILLHKMWLPDLSKLNKAQLDQLKAEIQALRALLQEMGARVQEVQQSYDRYTKEH